MNDSDVKLLERRREINRKAASKSRRRQRERAVKLKQLYFDAQSKNTALNYEKRQLSRRIKLYRDLILEHSKSFNCRNKQHIKEVAEHLRSVLRDADSISTFERKTLRSISHDGNFDQFNVVENFNDDNSSTNNSNCPFRISSSDSDLESLAQRSEAIIISRSRTSTDIKQSNNIKLYPHGYPTSSRMIYPIDNERIHENFPDACGTAKEQMLLNDLLDVIHSDHDDKFNDLEPLDEDAELNYGTRTMVKRLSEISLNSHQKLNSAGLSASSPQESNILQATQKITHPWSHSFCEKVEFISYSSQNDSIMSNYCDTKTIFIDSSTPPLNTCETFRASTHGLAGNKPQFEYTKSLDMKHADLNIGLPLNEKNQSYLEFLYDELPLFSYNNLSSFESRTQKEEIPLHAGSTPALLDNMIDPFLEEISSDFASSLIDDIDANQALCEHLQNVSTEEESGLIANLLNFSNYPSIHSPDVFKTNYNHSASEIHESDRNCPDNSQPDCCMKTGKELSIKTAKLWNDTSSIGVEMNRSSGTKDATVYNYQINNYNLSKNETYNNKSEQERRKSFPTPTTKNKFFETGSVHRPQSYNENAPAYTHIFDDIKSCFSSSEYSNTQKPKSLEGNTYVMSSANVFDKFPDISSFEEKEYKTWTNLHPTIQADARISILDNDEEARRRISSERCKNQLEKSDDFMLRRRMNYYPRHSRPYFSKSSLVYPELFEDSQESTVYSTWPSSVGKYVTIPWTQSFIEDRQKSKLSMGSQRSSLGSYHSSLNDLTKNKSSKNASNISNKRSIVISDCLEEVTSPSRMVVHSRSKVAKSAYCHEYIDHQTPDVSLPSHNQRSNMMSGKLPVEATSIPLPVMEMTRKVPKVDFIDLTV